MNIQIFLVVALALFALLLFKRGAIMNFINEKLLLNVSKTTYTNSVIVLCVAFFFGLSYIGASVSKSVRPTKEPLQKHDDDAYFLSDEEAAELRALYEKEKNISDSIILTNIASLKNEVFCTDFNLIPAYINKVKEYSYTINNSKNSPLKSEAIKALKAYQSTNFPAARKLYYQNAKDKLWHDDIEVEMIGRTITFIGSEFSLNAVKEDTYLEIRQELEDLRFTDVGFKGFSGDNRTYWNLSYKQDSDI